MKRTLAVLILTMMLGGCAGNGFTAFYSGMTLEQVHADPWFVPDSLPLVARLPDKPADDVMNEMFAKGYTPIGTSKWEGPDSEGNEEAADQARKIGAAYVLWRSDYSHTRQGAMPITTYNPGGTSTTYHSGNVYSGGANGNYSGTSTTYHPGTTTTNYVPYSVDRYKYTAIFFAKFKPGILGVKLDDPGTDYKRKFDTQSGAIIKAVMNNGRAFQANIFPGDIIMSANGMPYKLEPAFAAWKFGVENVVRIYRDGQIIEKKIFIEAQ